MLYDRYNRKASYLRLAVTDQCNLRCRYCMPEEGIDFSLRKELLTFEEIIRVSKILKNLGVEKLRITGGEPFVRKDLPDLLTQLCHIFPEVHITTNATLLHKHLDHLQQIGIKSLNISIDSLDRNKFFMITRRDNFKTVLENIFASISSGILTKLNVVTMKGINDKEILEFVQFAIDHRIVVRFIEAMPFNDDDGNKEQYMSAAQVKSQIQSVYPSLRAVDKQKISSSQSYLIQDQFKIGIIPAYTRSLCGMCDRIRLTPKGELLNCLYASKGLDLNSLVRNKKNSDQQITAQITAHIINKKKNGFEEEAERKQNVFNSMTTIGG